MDCSSVINLIKPKLILCLEVRKTPHYKNLHLAIEILQNLSTGPFGVGFQHAHPDKQEHKIKYILTKLTIKIHKLCLVKIQTN